MNLTRILPFAAALAISPVALACSDEADAAGVTPDAGGASAGATGDPSGASGAGMGGADTEPLDPQVPPSNAAEMAQWLAAFESNGWAEDWICEDDFTEKTDGAAAIHVHGANRVCNNRALAAASLSDDAQLPSGAAALKFVERGIYVEVKVGEESDGGKGWFWYAPNGEVSGTGLASCTGCHSAAGADDDHPGLGDYVYFQVK
ncbi:MAG: hypothetical protein K0R38_909 [Polyangiaceae bacterium]|jgi:hypothetical protein|nr:hypothetical protein [Polyangiaceae bacterium]